MRDRRLHVRVYRDDRIAISAMYSLDGMTWRIAGATVLHSMPALMAFIQERIIGHPLSWEVHIRYQGTLNT